MKLCNAQNPLFGSHHLVKNKEPLPLQRQSCFSVFESQQAEHLANTDLKSVNSRQNNPNITENRILKMKYVLDRLAAPDKLHPFVLNY